MKKTIKDVCFGIYISVILIVFLLLIFSFIVHYNAKHTSCENLSVPTKGPAPVTTSNPNKIFNNTSDKGPNTGTTISPDASTTQALPKTSSTTNPTTKVLDPNIRNNILGNTWYTPNAMSPMVDTKPSVSPVTKDSLNNMNKNTSTMLSTIQNNQSSVFKLF